MNTAKESKKGGRTRAKKPMEATFPASGVVAIESRHARGFEMPLTRHDYFKVLLPFHGEGFLSSPGSEVRLAAGEAVLVPPGCEHRIVDRSPLSLYVVCFRPSEYAAGWNLDCCRSGHPEKRSGAGGEILDLVRRLLHEQTVPVTSTDAMARGLAWQMLATLARAPRMIDGRVSQADPTGSRARVEEAGQDLRRRFFEPLQIDRAAERAGLGRRRFTQLFRAVHGVSWWEALNSIRLEHAEELLARTERSVASVAFECGYGDLSGFYRAWGGAHDHTPQIWRARFRR